MKHDFRITLAALLMGLFMASCARIGAPPGGLEDKTGAKVTASFPVADTTNVPRKLVARIVFSKAVNHQSVESALYLSPDPRQRLRYHWHGNALDLIYMDSLDANRTYVISVGSQAKDLRGNPAGTTTTIAFSTGSRIDRGSIDGWVSDVAAPQAVSVWAYQIRGDTVPNPISDEADYRLQVGSDFKFRFTYLRAGRYRVYAAMDRNFDGLWNPSVEALGIPPWDVTVRDSVMPWISFKLMMQDSSAPGVRASRGVNAQEVDVRTTRPVPNLIASFADHAGDSVIQRDAFPDSAGSEVWRVFPKSLLRAGTWTINVAGTDNFGRPWQGSDSVDVRALSDTSRPHLAQSDPPLRAIVRTPPAAIRLSFDKPVMLDSLTTADFRLSQGADTDTVNVSLVPRSPHVLSIIPATPFTAGKHYKLTFSGKHVRDFSDHALSDTTVLLSFGIYLPDSLGGLKGGLNTKAGAQYIYRLLDVKNHREIAETVAPGPGPFSLDLLPVGKYLVEVTRDVNRDSTFTYGRMWPFEFSEPFLASPDTVSIRARWEYETQMNWQDNP